MTIGSSRAGRERLVASAERLFPERGLRGVSVRELIADAGATRPLLYHHFGSKEGLCREAVRRSVRRLDAALAAAASSSGSATERLARDGKVHAEAVHARALALDRQAPGVRESVVGLVRDLLVDALGSIAPDDHELDGTRLAVVAAAEFSARLSDRGTGDGSLDDLARMLTTLVRGARGRGRPEASPACTARAATDSTSGASLPEAHPCT
ncbi:MAG TPA: helix-turn-helix domain-containing protein [Thermoanaerobaculia bacterium]|nr:helix-turn-helix domain-containing protein [Thermoanaerobaculia bacterium]